MLGFPLADPIVGLLISIAIIFLLRGTVRSIGRRLMHGIEPELLDRTQTALEIHRASPRSRSYSCGGSGTASRVRQPSWSPAPR